MLVDKMAQPAIAREFAELYTRLVEGRELNEAQIQQLLRQINHHSEHKKPYRVDMPIAEGVTLKDFIVHPNQMDPSRMTSLKYAQFVYASKDLQALYLGADSAKRVLSLGCGTGSPGLVFTLSRQGTGLFLPNVLFADISQDAIENARQNMLNLKSQYHGIESRCTFVQSDLFRNIDGQFDLIEFNHPFFPISRERYDPENNYPILRTMLGGDGDILHRFLDEAQGKGPILMPYYHLLGPTNDPAVQAPKHGYSVQELHREINTQGVQQGLISFYLLKSK